MKSTKLSNARASTLKILGIEKVSEQIQKAIPSILSEIAADVFDEEVEQGEEDVVEKQCEEEDKHEEEDVVEQGEEEHKPIENNNQVVVEVYGCCIPSANPRRVTVNCDKDDSKKGFSIIINVFPEESVLSVPNDLQ